MTDKLDFLRQYIILMRQNIDFCKRGINTAELEILSHKDADGALRIALEMTELLGDKCRIGRDILLKFKAESEKEVTE